MECEQCHQFYSMESTDEQEADTIDADCCHLTFVCKHCGALYSIEFQPVEVTYIGQSERNGHDLAYSDSDE